MAKVTVVTSLQCPIRLPTLEFRVLPLEFTGHAKRCAAMEGLSEPAPQWVAPHQYQDCFDLEQKIDAWEKSSECIFSSLVIRDL